MSELKTIIVEDTIGHREILESLLATECPSVKVVAYARSAEEGYHAIQLHRPDLVFIDIDLHNSTGFDMLQRLQSEDAINFEMIFLTAYGTHEDETLAIEYSALDFIHKPPTPNALRMAVNNATRLMDKPMYKRQVDNMISHVKGDKKEEREIVFDLSRGVKDAVKVNDILYLKAAGTMTEIFLKGRPKLTAMKNLGYYSKMLGAELQFFQIHHGTVVNLHEVKQVDKQGKKVTLHSGQPLDCAKRRFDGLMQVWNALKSRPGGGGRWWPDMFK